MMGHRVWKRGRQESERKNMTNGKNNIVSWFLVGFLKLFYHLPLASQIFRAQRAVPTF